MKLLEHRDRPPTIATQPVEENQGEFECYKEYKGYFTEFNLKNVIRSINMFNAKKNNFKHRLRRSAKFKRETSKARGQSPLLRRISMS
jgi:hypothetical protein